MERTAWTDERLDDLAHRVETGFTHVDVRFDRVDRDIGDLRAELRTEVGLLRSVLARIGGGIIVGLIGVIAAILAAI